MTQDKIANIHKLLSDETRWEIVKTIRDKKEATVEDLLKVLKITNSTLCFHMSKLIKGGLVVETKKKKIIYYSLKIDSFVEAFEYMDGLLKQAIRHNEECKFSDEDLRNTFFLFEDPKRVEIVNIIVNNPGITAKQIRIDADISDADLSFHLKKLVEGNGIIEKKISNQHHYWIRIGYALAFHHHMATRKDGLIKKLNKR